MPRLWYPNQSHVAMVRRLMAARFFPEYQEDSPPPLFGVIGGREGQAGLDSALNVIRQPYYRGIHNKAGALLRSMIKNHPFVDGNKRIALVTTFNFLAFNGQVLVLATNAQTVQFALEIAESEPDMPWRDVANWIRAHCILDSTSPEGLMARLEGRSPEDIQQIGRQAGHLRDLFTDVAQRLGASTP